jgi:CRP-like cAMP-binding protein
VISTVEKVLFLKSIDLFASVPGEDLAQIALIATEERCEAGDEIFAEGDVGDALYVVLEGKVRIHRADESLAELGSRACFGEMAVLDASPRAASATAVDDSRLIRITREDFRDLLADRADIATAIIQVLTRRLRDEMR